MFLPAGRIPPVPSAESPRLASKSEPDLLALVVASLAVLLAAFSGFALYGTDVSVGFLGTFSAIVLLATLLLGTFAPKGYATLFACGLLVRMAFVLAWTWSPPISVGPEQQAGVLYKDEAFYVTAALDALAVGWSDWLDSSDVYERIALYYAAIFAWAGPGLLWGRVVNALLSALTTVCLLDAIRSSTTHALHCRAWWVAGLAPELFLWSALYLKETLLILGVAVIVNAAVRMRTQGPSFRRWTYALIGASVCLFARFEVLVPLIPLVCVAGSRSLLSRRRRLFGLVVVFGACAFVALTLAMQPLAGWLNTDVAYFERQHALAADAGIEFPLFDSVVALPGPLRTLGFGCLLLVSPLITGLWALLPVVGTPSWLVFSEAAQAVTWWGLMPFWLIAAVEAFRQRDGWWALLACILVAWILIAASMRFGVGTDAIRYRAAYLPVTVLLAVRGCHYLHEGVVGTRRWRAALKCYFALVLLLVVLRGIGVVRI